MFLKLSSQIEGQLREAYAKKQEAGILNQSVLAKKLDVDRSAINRRLTGQVNMTEETVADMVWALDHDIEVRIFDPATSQTNHTITSVLGVAAQAPVHPAANTTIAVSTNATTSHPSITPFSPVVAG